MKCCLHQFSKSTGQRWIVFYYIWSYVCVIVYGCHSPWQNENDKDPKFGTLRRLCLKKVHFFLEEVTLKASSFEKLPYHMDFPDISVIAMHFFLDLFIETPHSSHI